MEELSDYFLKKLIPKLEKGIQILNLEWMPNKIM